MEKLTTEVVNRNLIKKVEEISIDNENQKFIIDMLQEEILELTRMILEDTEFLTIN